MTPDVNTRLEDLPSSVAGFTIANEDATYTIVINARVSHERAKKAYEHEMRHINGNDFDNEIEVDKTEAERHEKEKE